MKALIVDDELHVREGVELSVDWEAHHIREIFMAEDGYEALDIVRREAPDVILCDMSMPRMDGVTFLETLRKEGWTSQVIVLSGYQEFRYARAALLAQGVDYVLKPFKIDDLNRAVAKAAAAIMEGRQLHRKEIMRNYELQEANIRMNEQKMAVCLQNDHPNPEVIRQLFTEAGFHAATFYVALFLPRNHTAALERFLGDEALFYFAMRNVLGEMIRPLGSSYVCRLESFFCLFIDGHAAVEEVIRQLTKLMKAWKDTIKLEMLQGFTPKKVNESELAARIKLTKAEILNTRITPVNRINAGQHGTNSGQYDANSKSNTGHSIDTFHLVDKEFIILESMKSGNKENVAALIRSFVKDIRNKPGLLLKELQQYTIEANLLILRVSKCLQQQHVVEPLSIWISDLTEFETVLIHSFWQLMEADVDAMLPPNSIQAIRHYLETHFNEDLSLTLLSEKFHFSPQHITKKFREAYNMTVVSYLTQLRMEKAKSLLLHSESTVSEIAQLVGYEDENYFGKVFRKHAGVSPTQFRRRQRN